HRQPRPTGLRRKAARKLSRNAARDFLQRDTLRDHFQLTSRILEIDFTKNRFWQIDTVDTPSPLGRELRRSVVETRRQSPGIDNRSRTTGRCTTAGDTRHSATCHRYRTSFAPAMLRQTPV